MLPLATTAYTSWRYFVEFADTGCQDVPFWPIVFGWFTWYFYQSCTGKMTDENDPFFGGGGKCNVEKKKDS